MCRECGKDMVVGGRAVMRKRLPPSLSRFKRKKRKKKDTVVDRGRRTIRNEIFLKVSGCSMLAPNYNN